MLGHLARIDVYVHVLHNLAICTNYCINHKHDVIECGIIVLFSQVRVYNSYFLGSSGHGLMC